MIWRYPVLLSTVLYSFDIDQCRGSCSGPPTILPVYRFGNYPAANPDAGAATGALGLIATTSADCGAARCSTQVAARAPAMK
jgi:hypothetical protein